MTDFTRSFPLLDIAVRSGGDGRTVEAYAAVWDTPTEISDQQGRYREQIARTAFNEARARSSYPVMFNHGMTMYGTPSDRWSAPVGVTESLRSDERGLVSVWRADPTPAGDEVLAMITSGSVRGQSFSGRWAESSPKMPRGGYRANAAGELPLVTRTNIVLRELGPTPFPAYTGAGIIGVRAAELASRISGLDPAERAELARLISTGTPLGEAVDATSAGAEPGAEDQPPTGHSDRQSTPAQRRAHILAAITSRRTP